MAAQIPMTPNLLHLSCFVCVHALRIAENTGACSSNSVIKSAQWKFSNDDCYRINLTGLEHSFFSSLLMAIEIFCMVCFLMHGSLKQWSATPIFHVVTNKNSVQQLHLSCVPMQLL